MPEVSAVPAAAAADALIVPSSKLTFGRTFLSASPQQSHTDGLATFWAVLTSLPLLGFLLFPAEILFDFGNFAGVKSQASTAIMLVIASVAATAAFLKGRACFLAILDSSNLAELCRWAVLEG